MSERWTLHEMLSLAARGVGKVDRLGPRGATLVSREETEAMAGALAYLGMVAVPPGALIPDVLVLPPCEDE